MPVVMNALCDRCSKPGMISASSWEIGDLDVAAVVSMEDLRRDGFVVHKSELLCVQCQESPQ